MDTVEGLLSELKTFCISAVDTHVTAYKKTGDPLILKDFHINLDWHLTHIIHRGILLHPQNSKKMAEDVLKIKAGAVEIFNRLISLNG